MNSVPRTTCRRSPVFTPFLDPKSMESVAPLIAVTLPLTAGLMLGALMRSVEGGVAVTNPAGELRRSAALGARAKSMRCPLAAPATEPDLAAVASSNAGASTFGGGGGGGGAENLGSGATL